MISVIIPVYNVERYVEKCICSVLGQTYRDFELILVDDGSEDSSGHICDSYEKKDSRVRVIHRENGGLSAARNTGLAAAKGEYITYIDSDDSVEAGYLEELLGNALRYDADVSVCAYRPVWEGKPRMQRPLKENPDVQVCTGREAVWKIVAENDRKMITAWGKLYPCRMKPLLTYPEGRLHEDEFITYRILYTADTVAVSQRPLYCYLQRGSSIMNSGYSERRLDKIAALEEAVAYFDKAGDEEMTRYARKRYLLQLSIACYKVSAFMPEDTKLTGRLQKEWHTCYKKYWNSIKGISGVTDRAAVRIYAASPMAYRLAARVYEKIYRKV